MEAGSVVRIALLQSNGELKSRPALLLKNVEPFNDWLLCSISSKLHNAVKGLDLILDEEHEDYKQSGLKYPGVVRVAHVFTMSEETIEGTIGKLIKPTLKRLKNNLGEYIKK